MRCVYHESRCERDQINAKSAKTLRRKGERGGLHREDRVAEDTEMRGIHCRLRGKEVSVNRA